MKKWNKYDSQFILRCLTASALAILIWTYFYSDQINKNYLNISLTEKEAKQKAQLYFGSRGWDVSGHIYSSKYSNNYGNERWNRGQNYNYIKENATNKELDKINDLNRLIGAHRWNMRWYNPPSSEEFQISFTKDGNLTYFNHILPDTLSGDSLSENIAYNIAKIFLKNMTNTNWQEDDWKLQIQWQQQEKNRLDHYFQWENNKHKFDNSTIRMSIMVKGNQVTRYNRWLEVPQKTENKFNNWAATSHFIDQISDFVYQIIALVSALIALFYFKIETNWKIAAKFSIITFVVSAISGFSEIMWQIYDFASENPIIGALSLHSTDILFESVGKSILLFLMVAGCEKIYRTYFQNKLSFSNLLKPASLTTKLFFKNYLAGIVFSLGTLAFTGFYYTLLDSSGYYIAFPFLDFNDQLTYIPLLYLISEGISLSIISVITYVAIVMIIYLVSKSRITSILISSLLLAVEGVLDIDPVYFGSLYLFIIGLASGFMLFRYGIISLFVSSFGSFIFSKLFLYLYTQNLYYITTSVILVLLLLAPLFYCLLFYFKHKSITSVKPFLNEAEITISENEGEKPSIPKIEKIKPPHKKLGIILCIIGLLCLFIPNNDEFQKYFEFKISKSDAIKKAKQIIEEDFNEDLTGFTESISQNFQGGNWGYSGTQIRPLRFMQRISIPPLAYLNEKVGRKGIATLINHNNIPVIGWMIRFFIPNVQDLHSINLDGQNNELTGYYHMISDSLVLPSVSEKDAMKIAQSRLKTQKIDISDFTIDYKSKADQNIRVDHTVTYKKDLTYDDEIFKQNIWTRVSGNKFVSYGTWIDSDQEWDRDYWEADFMYFLTAWLPLILLMTSLIHVIFYLIINSNGPKKQLSWKFITLIFSFISFSIITDYINFIPRHKSHYWPNKTWLVHWYETISWDIAEIGLLFFIVIVPISCVYIINPIIKNLFLKQTRQELSKDVLISSISTFGAMLLYRPIKYILYSLFPNYIDMSAGHLGVDSIVSSLFSYSYPAYGLLLSILIETLILFAFCIFFYHRFMDYSMNGNKLKKNLLLLSITLFYLFYNSFFESTVIMIPYFLSRLSGLIILLLLIKYFWKGNPLSHLFGIIIYFQLDRILTFIALADPTIKPQGWILLALIIALFLYTVVLEVFRSQSSSRTI